MKNGNKFLMRISNSTVRVFMRITNQNGRKKFALN